MTKYRFEHTENDKSVIVELYKDEKEDGGHNLEEVVGAFVQFLRGVTFEGASIAKFIKHDLAG